MCNVSDAAHGRYGSCSGVSFLEAIMVIAVAAILAVVAAPSVRRMKARMDLRSSANAIKYRMMAARGRAMSDISIHCGVHFDTAGTFRMFLDADTAGAGKNRYNSGDDWFREALALSSGVAFKQPESDVDVLHATNANAVVFRGDGSAAAGQGTRITLVETTFGFEKAVDVLPSTGRIRLE